MNRGKIGRHTVWTCGVQETKTDNLHISVYSHATMAHLLALYCKGFWVNKFEGKVFCLSIFFVCTVAGLCLETNQSPFPSWVALQ